MVTRSAALESAGGRLGQLGIEIVTMTPGLAFAASLFMIIGAPTPVNWDAVFAPTARTATEGNRWSALPKGEVRIEVVDSSGNPIAASGRLRNLSNGVERSFKADLKGRYTFAGLSYGRYLVEVERSGFASQAALIDVDSDAPILRTLTMSVGSLAFNVDVVGTTPLPGNEMTASEIPAPVQAASHDDIEASRAINLTDFLNRRINGVHVNEIQGNPLQQDVNYRGYTASPLLGTPQGLSVYMDGVRLNQPFGDVVSWDLIPRTAIAEVVLMPGSDPLFGLNTLGGALALQTKDGRRHPITAIRMSGGSFGRAAIDFEHAGAAKNGLNWYLGSDLFFEDGWRADSASNVRQFFGKIGWQGQKTVLALSVAYANNSLTGNGLQEGRFLDRDYDSIYTTPDVTDNRSPFINFVARRSVGSSLTFSGNVYFRFLRTITRNADINEDSLDQSLYQPNAAERAALSAAGYTGFPTSGETAANTPFPYWRCIAQSLLRAEPAETCNGLINRTRTRQHNYGVSGQVSWLGLAGGRRNLLTAGGAYDQNAIGFGQSTQLGYLNADRSVTSVSSFGDGVSGGSVDGEPYDTRVDLEGRGQTWSIYATNTISIASRWNLKLAARYNRTAVDNADQIILSGEPGSLDGHHVFGRLNPAVGLTFSPTSSLNTYFGYNEGSRAPTSVELGCADPQLPCKLPNAMAGDPPLQQVVTRTLEAGLRSGREGRLIWSVGWFRAENRNDLLFVASNQTGFGYFKNFGKTRRQGVELEVNGRIWRVNLGAAYTFLDATYESHETVDGSSNSTNDAAAASNGLEGSIQIVPGARIPLIPQQMVKAFADLQVTAKLKVNLDLLALSSCYARGNENNLHQPDGQYYLGGGVSAGYAVVNLGARYQLTRRLELFGHINNVFDTRYYTAAQLGPTGFTSEGNFIARPFPGVGGEFPLQHGTFYAPGAPRGIWAGIKLEF